MKKRAERRRYRFLAVLLALAGTNATADDAAAPPAAESAPAGAPAETATAVEPERPAGGPSLKVDGSALARAAAAAIQADASLVAPDRLVLRLAAHGSVVSLHGTAATIYDREQAARGAESVPGVSRISPSIRIQPPARVEAEALADQVKAAVVGAGVAGPDFSARVSGDGVVQLGGSVTHEYAAVDAVKRVPGVTAIGGYEAALPGAIRGIL